MNPINLNKKSLFLLHTEIRQNKLVAFIGKEQRGYVFMTKTGEEFVIEHTSKFQDIECVEKVTDNVFTRFIPLNQKEIDGINKCKKCALDDSPELCDEHACNDRLNGISLIYLQDSIMPPSSLVAALELSPEQQLEFNKCEKFNCYYKNDPTSCCPSCYSLERDDNENGYYLEVTI